MRCASHRIRGCNCCSRIVRRATRTPSREWTQAGVVRLTGPLQPRTFMQSRPEDRSGPRSEGEMPTRGALARHTGTAFGRDCSYPCSVLA
jgi:hypothetical protein